MTWMPYGTDQFLGPLKRPRAAFRSTFENAAALIQMGDWCESARADRKPTKENDGCERVEAACTKVSAQVATGFCVCGPEGEVFFSLDNPFNG
jgi:hypothetical protein